jgi:hypothetical protein
MSAPEALRRALAGRYDIVRELGAGGMATVYLARDVKHDRDVALKVLNPNLTESLGRERFLREIRLAARLNHPNILPLYDSGEAAGFLFFVMPVMLGQTLRDRLAVETGRLVFGQRRRLRLYVTHEDGPVKRSCVKFCVADMRGWGKRREPWHRARRRAGLGPFARCPNRAPPLEVWPLQPRRNRRSPFTHSGSIRPMFQYCEQGPIQLRWARGPLT